MWLVAGLVLGINSAHASDCAVLLRGYENAAKRIALENAGLTGDNNVYRAILVATKITNIQLTRQMNLTIMVNDKCPLPESAGLDSDYILDAEKCNLEYLKGNAESAACQINTWNKLKLP
jgi:hypothetical protein